MRKMKTKFSITKSFKGYQVLLNCKNVFKYWVLILFTFITFKWIKLFKITEKENKAFIKILEAFGYLNNNEKKSFIY